MPVLWVLAGSFPAAVAATEPPGGRMERLEFDPANQAWRPVAAPQPGTPEGDLALARRMLSDGDPSGAQEAAEDWLDTYSGHHLAREARLLVAQALIARRRYYKAHETLKELLAEVGSDDVTIQALEAEFVIAEVFLSGTKRRFLGMRLVSAEDVGIEILDYISNNFPGTTLGELALKTKGDYYYNRGDFVLAEDEYSQLVTAYPRSRYLRWGGLQRAQATVAQFPGTEFDDAPLIEAEERFMQFRQMFPQAAADHDVDLLLEDIRARRAQKEFEVGQYYLRVDKPQAAAFYFRSVMQNWPDTAWSTRAQSQLEQLGQPAAPPPPAEETSGDTTE